MKITKAILECLGALLIYIILRDVLGAESAPSHVFAGFLGASLYRVIKQISDKE